MIMNVRRKTILTVFLLTSITCLAPQEVGSGGDAVYCKEAPENPFSGYYSLDYLVQYSKTLESVQVKDLEESLSRIESELSRKVPELLADFKSFRRDLFNETDFHRPHIWDKAPFGLIDLKDEELITQLPENCRNGDKTSVVQAVIRLTPVVTGLPQNKINYKYVPRVVDDLAQNNPVQLSFLLVHEWLWSFSSNVERNRRINYWLHSSNLENWTREEWRANLHSIGFVIPNLQPPVWESSLCEFHQTTVNKIRRYALKYVPRLELFQGEGQAFKRTIHCDKRTGCVGQKYSDETQKFRTELKSPIKVVAYIQGRWPGIASFAPDEKGEIDPDSLYMDCEVTADGKPNLGCRYLDNDVKTEFLGHQVIGKDCVIFKAQTVTDKGTYNKVEEVHGRVDRRPRA